MSLFDLLTSLPDAPGSGFGPGPPIVGGLPAVGGSSPPTCGPSPAPEGPDHTPDPGYTPAPRGGEGVSWDEGGDGGEQADADPITMGDSTFYPSGGMDDFVSKQMIDRYGDWVKTGSPAGRALKAATGLVVLPIAAVALCLESSVRTPLVGGSISK